VQPVETAAYPDAAEVARGAGISVAEAARRLRLQESSAGQVSRLRREFADRLAGIYREAEGDYRLVVRLKGAAPIADRWIGSGRDRMRIQFLAGAPSTLAEILESLAAAMPAIGARLPGLMGTGVDERTGEAMLDIYAVGDDVARARASEPEIERLLGHPVQLRISASPVTLEGQAPSPRALRRPPGPGTPEWGGHMQRLARAARYPGYPNPRIQSFHRESRPLIQRIQADPAFAGLAFRNDNEPYAIVLFTGDAAAHLAHYTRDPRYWPKSAGLTRAQLQTLQDSYGKLLQQLEIHYTFSSSDDENNRVTFSISEMDKYRSCGGAAGSGRACRARGYARASDSRGYAPSHSPDRSRACSAMIRSRVTLATIEAAAIERHLASPATIAFDGRCQRGWHCRRPAPRPARTPAPRPRGSSPASAPNRC
jgi:hypothetical protein